MNIQDPHIELQQQIPPQNGLVNQVPSQSSQPSQDDALYKSARSKFVFKVYAILSIQLTITSIFVALTMYFQQFAKFQNEHIFLSIISALVVMSCMIALMCKRQLSEVFPKNMLILGTFTLAQSYLVSSVCAMYTTQSVIIAAGATAAATIGITLYTKYSGTDFSSIRQLLTGIGSSFIMVAMFISIASFWLKIPFLSGLIALGMSIIYPLYLIYDTQMILDNVKHNLSLDQYVLGSLFLYIDIIGIFLDILRLLGQRR